MEVNLFRYSAFSSSIRSHFGGSVRILLTILTAFEPFPLLSTFASALFELAVSVCSEGVCGMFCGQKRSPSFAGTLHRQGRGAFFVFLAVCIVALGQRVGKWFLYRTRLRNWGAVNKETGLMQVTI